MEGRERRQTVCCEQHQVKGKKLRLHMKTHVNTDFKLSLPVRHPVLLLIRIHTCTCVSIRIHTCTCAATHVRIGKASNPNPDCRAV